ncbi:MAG TPA: PilZ domain-containing protein [Candidatus Acidoferrum sp.]|nr:PilZ domain-containing protein [Candidatus Acidoferrum sp.]
MGRRSEQRIAFRVPILVRGKDSRGSPFVITAQVMDITATGASLNGLKGIADVGSKIEIEYQGRKAMYRIQWLGRVGTPRSGQAGVKCLEPGNYIWGVPLAEWAPDTFDPYLAEPPASAPVGTIDALVAPHASGLERRRFPRVSCRIEANVTEESSGMNLPVKVTDISLGGCYVEMLAPLPLNSSVELTMDTAHGAIQARGKVITAQTGMGMGIAFAAVSPEDFERLRAIAPPAPRPAERESAKPRPAAASAASSNGGVVSRRASQIGPSTQEVLESIVRILLRKGILTEEEMAEEFEKLIIAKS